MDDYNAQTPAEVRLAQEIIENKWRIRRSNMIETRIFARAEEELKEEAKKFTDPTARHAWILTETYMRYERTLRNLQIRALYCAHDTSFAYNPIGSLIQLLRNILHIGGPRKPCPM